MANFTQKDFDAHGERISQDYITERIPLEEGIYKVATEKGLNPTQVNQLVWSTNTKTHLALFDKKAEDKIIDFPLADASSVILRIYGDDAEEPEEKNASADVVHDFYAPLAAPVKTAEVHETPAMRQAVPDHVKVLTLRKLASVLESKVLGARLDYEEKVYEIGTELRKIAQHPDMTQEDWRTLQIDAASALGEYRENILRDTKLLDKSSTVKTAEVYDDSHTVIASLREAEALYLSAVKYAQNLAYLRKNASALKE